MSDRAHWDAVYATKRADAVSWFQPTAARSVALVRRAAPDPSVPVLDVGGGASVLVDELLALGYGDLTVLDLAAGALAVARARLGAAASAVRWLEGDVRTAPLPSAGYAVWHDRAVFHFLTDPADRAAYAAQLRHALRPGGHAIVATFAEDGPTRCSGLPVQRYDAAALHAALGPGFALVASERNRHVTPTHTEQAFTYVLLRRTADDHHSPTTIT